MLTLTPADHPEMPDKAEKPGQGFESGGNHTEYRDAWSFGLKAKPREANQRPAPMTEMVAMVIRNSCYGNLVTIAMVICLVAMVM